MPVLSKIKSFFQDPVTLQIISPLSGNLIPLLKVNDLMFSSGLLGQGVGIIPIEGKLYSPFDGTIYALFPTGHALGLKSRKGIDLLIHIGLNTTTLNGEFFQPHIKQGQHIKKGQLLVSFNLNEILAAGYDVTTPIIVNNTKDYSSLLINKEHVVSSLEPLITLTLP